MATLYSKNCSKTRAYSRSQCKVDSRLKVQALTSGLQLLLKFVMTVHLFLTKFLQLFFSVLCYLLFLEFGKCRVEDIQHIVGVVVNILYYLTFFKF